MPKSGIVWIASYPKSGNTWARFIYFFLVHGRAHTSSAEVDRFVNAKLPAPEPVSSLRLVKTHAHMDALSVYVKHTDSAIYVHRHPLDALCSALNYALLTGEVDLEGLSVAALDQWKQSWIAAFLETGGHPLWLESPFNCGTWCDNMKSWVLDPPPFRVLRLAYEDLLQGPEAAVRQIAKFAELSVAPESIRECVEATSFVSLRRMEATEIALANTQERTIGRFSVEARRKAASMGIKFFNEGRSGYYREVLSKSQILKGQQVFSDVARQFGYGFD